MDQTYMKEQPVLKLIVSMALPMVISMMVSSLYNIVDSFFIARISEDAMTALSLVYPVQNLINAVMIGFGIGINAVISFYLGAQDKKMADRAATQGMLLGTIHGVGFMILGIAVMRPFLQMFTGNAQIVDYGVRYSRIAFLFATALSWQLVFEKTFQAVGRMVESMTCMMSGAIINIILDPVLIFGLGPFPKMGIEGAALATGIGQAAGAVLYLIFYIVNPLPVKYRKKYLKADLKLWKKLYVIGIPASLNLALPSLLISVLNVILTGYGEVYVFVLGVYYKLQTFLYLPANGIVQGMRPLLGYNYGESDNDEGRKCGTQSHQSWIPCFIGIGYLQRGTGRSWKRCAFTDHFVMQICGCDYSGGIHCQPFYGSGRSMACVLDHGSGDCGDCVCGVSEGREGIVEEIAKEII